jgi:hypothetical protein
MSLRYVAIAQPFCRHSDDEEGPKTLNPWAHLSPGSKHERGSVKLIL